MRSAHEPALQRPHAADRQVHARKRLMRPHLRELIKRHEDNLLRETKYGWRDDDGYWTKVETYLSTHSDAEFSHGICPDCTANHYGSLYPDGEPVLKEDQSEDEDAPDDNDPPPDDETPAT